MSLQDDITGILNFHSREINSNTPDFILAQYLMTCLEAFERASNVRENWYGKHLSINNDQEEFRS